MVFYVGLLSDSSLSNSDRVVYSYLMYSSIASWDGIYDNSGVLSQGRLCEYFAINGDEFYVGYSRLTLSFLSRALGYSKEQCRRCLESLRLRGYIELRCDKRYYIKMIREIVMGSFFTIDESVGHLTSSRVFYFFLRNKSMPYGGKIDTWLNKLSEEFCTTTSNVKSMLSRLKREGLISRENGVLVIK